MGEGGEGGDWNDDDPVQAKYIKRKEKNHIKHGGKNRARTVRGD